MANIEYTLPYWGEEKFWDFYALELLNTSVNTVSSEKNQKFRHSIVQLQQEVNSVFNQCSSQLFDGIMGYLSKWCSDEFSYALGDPYSDDQQTDYPSLCESLIGELFKYWETDQLKNVENKRNVEKQKNEIKRNIKQIKKEQGLSNKMPAGTLLKLLIYYVKKDLIGRDVQFDDSDDKELFEKFFKSLKNNTIFNELYPLLKENKNSITDYFSYQDMYNIFNENYMWDSQYGGPSWAKATEVYVKYGGRGNNLSSREKTVIIDYVYDLEHNNGSLLNKTKHFWVPEHSLNSRYKKIQKPQDYLKNAYIGELSDVVIKLIKKYMVLTQEDKFDHPLPFTTIKSKAVHSYNDGED